MKIEQKAHDILKTLQSHADSKSVQGMARFGINPEKAYGISIPVLRKLAKEIGENHSLSQNLWSLEVHEGRILASMIADAKQMTPQQMDEWVRDFNSWDVCDQTCMNVFRYTPFAYSKAEEWCHDEKEFVRRAGFAMMAALAIGDKKAHDDKFIPFLRLVILYSTDQRNFVKKAVNWALRQIGKRNSSLNKRAIAVARELKRQDTKSARWIGSDALRELQSDVVQARLARQNNKP